MQTIRSNAHTHGQCTVHGVDLRVSQDGDQVEVGDSVRIKDK